MSDQFCEELSFPTLLPTGKFGFNADRDVPLSVIKYGNSRLLNHTGRFASNPEYLFFMQYVIEQKKVADSISIALRKIQGQGMTAGSLRSGMQHLENMIYSDRAFVFLQKIPGSPSYCKKFQSEVFTMVKHLGIPTWFMTLSCADLRWKELLEIVCKCHKLALSSDELETLGYDEKFRLLNLNPVITARHFQYRVEAFFKEILLSQLEPLGRIIYYAIRIEFQHRGAPHAHCLLWTSNAIKLTSTTKDLYADFINKHIQALLPEASEDEELFHLANTHQRHSHSRTCRKYKNFPCRFHFGHFFSAKTIIAEPLPNDMDETVKAEHLRKRETLLMKVKEYIDECLNPSKRLQFNSDQTIQAILHGLGITEDKYYNALSTSPDSEFKLILKRPPDSCFISNYFKAGPKAFKANIDIQPVFDYFRCVAYMCAYFSKTESLCSESLHQAAKEVFKQNLNIKDSLKKLGATFLSAREVSAQECVYRCMPELWLRKMFPGTIFVSTDLPENRLKMIKKSQDLEQLDEHSTDIFQRNLIDRYADRPYVGNVNNLCLAKFAAYYYKLTKCDSEYEHPTNDNQPQVLTDDVTESQHQEDTSLPQRINLISSKEVMRKRKVRAVVRFHKFNETKEQEKCAHHSLMLYFPWRKESDLLGNDGRYSSKIDEQFVKKTVARNRQFLEPYCEEVETAQELLSNTSDVDNIFGIVDPCDDENSENGAYIDDNIPNSAYS